MSSGSLSGVITPKTQTITCWWSDWPSQCDGAFPKQTEMHSFSGFLPENMTPLRFLLFIPSVGRTGGSYTSQGHCRLVLCGGWRPHRPHWILCNYRMPLILHCFKIGCYWRYSILALVSKKETIPQRSVVRFTQKQILLQTRLTMGAMKKTD